MWWMMVTLSFVGGPAVYWEGGYATQGRCQMRENFYNTLYQTLVPEATVTTECLYLVVPPPDNP